MNEQQQELNDDLFGDIPVPSPPPALNEGQQWAHDQTVMYVTEEGTILEVPIPKIILIKGYAGTGKTFTMTRIIDTLLKWSSKQTYLKQLSIAASAPTHKAVRVMRKNAEFGSKVAYSTIHSLLGIKPEPDNASGKQVFKKSTDPEDGKIGDYNLLILDEISMLGKELWDHLMEAMEEHKFKLILLGDPVQIPPVKEKDSLPFLDTGRYSIEVLELTQSMRQAKGNSILEYATAIRECYKTQSVKADPFARVNENGGIQMLKVGDTKETDTILEDHFGSDRFKVDADYMKVIAWTNRTVDEFNRKIRRMLYAIPEGMMGLPDLVHTEKIILDDRYIVPDTNGLVLPNNEELEIVSYQVRPKAVSYKLWHPMGYIEKTLNPMIYDCVVQYKKVDGSMRKVNIHIVHEKSAATVKDMMSEIEKSAKDAPYQSGDRSHMWKHFYSIKDKFARYKYNYAVTAHKSQGSTYENCMLIQWDIGSNPNVEERNRINYVGVTRAKKMLYIVR